MSRGVFITFEGIDGAGKSTQIAALATYLKEHGHEVVRTREPGGTPLAEKIRALLLSEPMQVSTETLLFFASRAEHIADVIEPALKRGAWVLSDRFTDATFAYQVGAKGQSAHFVETLEKLVQGDLQPNHTVLFDITPEIAATRRAKARAADRFESEDLAFFSAVRAAYLRRAEVSGKRFFILDATQNPETMTERLLAEARTWL